MALVTHKESSLGVQASSMPMHLDAYQVSVCDPLSSIDMNDGCKMWILNASSGQGNIIYHFVKVLKSGESESLIVNPAQLSPSDQIKFLPLQLCLWERSNALMTRKMEAAALGEKRFLTHAEAMLTSIKQDMMASSAINRNLMDTAGNLGEQANRFGQSVIRFQSNVSALGKAVNQLETEVSKTAQEIRQFRAETWTAGVKYSTTISGQTTELDLRSIFSRFAPPALQMNSEHSADVQRQPVMFSRTDDCVRQTAGPLPGALSTSFVTAESERDPLTADERAVSEQKVELQTAPRNLVIEGNRGGSHAPAFRLESTEGAVSVSTSKEPSKSSPSVELQKPLVEKEDEPVLQTMWSKWSAFFESILSYFNSFFKPFSS